MDTQIVQETMIRLEKYKFSPSRTRLAQGYAISLCVCKLYHRQMDRHIGDH